MAHLNVGSPSRTRLCRRNFVVRDFEVTAPDDHRSDSDVIQIERNLNGIGRSGTWAAYNRLKRVQIMLDRDFRVPISSHVLLSESMYVCIDVKWVTGQRASWRYAVISDRVEDHLMKFQLGMN